MKLANALAAAPVVLDGGLATWLEAAGHDLRDRLWSARLLADDPAAIIGAHRDFAAAGARMITTASYQATVEGFVRAGHDRARAEALIRSSVELVRTAIGDRPRWIAASVGPYGATLADGSEYRGDYGLSHGELVAFHRPRLELLASAGPDVLALETIPDVREARALLDALDGLGIPAWLSYTIDGDRTRAGQRLDEAFGIAADREEIIAVGVNCCSPADATAAVAVAARESGRPVVVYPNSGERWDAVRRAWIPAGDAADFAALAQRWIADGARLLGGCCRVTPREIATIAAVIARLRDGSLD